MNESTSQLSEIIENLKIGIESNETKLKELIDEKNKDPSENRLIDLTNIIRITEQEIKYSKEDLESAEKTIQEDKTMKTDKQSCPPEADIKIAFEKINNHRKAIAMVEKPYNDQIKTIDDKVDEMIADLMANRARLVKQMAEDTEQTFEAIEILTGEIKEMVLENGKSCSTIFGACTHVKGRKASITWDDAALMGYVAADKEHETLLQFRTEGKEGTPSTRFKLIDL